MVRRHIFSLFGAATTLALGIAFGAGPLQGDDGGDKSSDLAAENARLSQELADVEARGQLDETLSAGAAPGWLHGRLAGAQVALVAFPEVDEDRVEAVRDAVAQAGGSVAVSLQVNDQVLDPGHKTYVSSVAASSLEGAGDIPGSRTSDPYARLGALLARAYVGHGEDIAIDDTATKIDAELEGAKLVSVEGRIQRRGSLVIVLASGSHGDDVGAQASSLIAETVIEGVVSASDGAVVATPPTGASAGGILAAVAADPDAGKLALATLDVSDGTIAQVATIYALSAAARGDGGDFGVTPSGVVLPPGMVNGVD
jgi:hypothetical protein